MTIFIIFPLAAILLAIVIYVLTHLIDEARKGLVKNVPRILLGGFFTGCVGAAILVGVFYRYPGFFLGNVSGWGVGTGDAPGWLALGIFLTKTGLGIIGFFLGFLLGVECLKRKFKRIEHLIDKIKLREKIRKNWKKILIIVALIIAGVIGYYYLYKAPFWEQRPAPPKELPAVSPAIEESFIGEETANWKVYRNEEYGYEIKYPQDWKIVNVDWTAGKEYVQFLSPLINNKYYFVLNFGARNKGNDIQISYQSDEDWELLKSLMRLGEKAKIGNVDVLTTEIVEKGKVHSILYSNRLGAGRVEISGLEIQANSGFTEGPQHLSASDVESIDLKNLPELKLANQILSTFKFIEE